ncbi:MAG: CapA family protein [Bacteroidota bacterium]
MSLSQTDKAHIHDLSSLLFLLCTCCFYCSSFHLAAQQDSLSLQLLFAGDIMGHGPQIRSAERIPDQSYDYTECFRYVKPILEEVDLAVGNLELTLPGKPPYGGFPMFRSPDALAEALREAGFDLIFTSNNHANDGGKNGLIHTIQALRENGLYQTGTFTSQEERDLYYPLIVYRAGFKLVFLNYTFSTNKNKTIAPTIVNKIDLQQMEKDMAEARNLEADAIIVMMHWGKEYRTTASEEQEALAQQLINWGADLIVGSHPHVVQPVVIKEVPEENRQVLISYSLGNFISNQRQTHTDGGMMLRVNLSKKNGTTQISDCSYIPIWRYIHRDEQQKATFYTLPIAQFETAPPSDFPLPAKDQKAMQRYATFIRELINLPEYQLLNLSY